MRHALLALPVAAIIAFSLPAMAQLPKKPEPKGTTEYSVEGQFSTYKQENPYWEDLKGKKAGLAARAAYMGPTSILLAAEARFAYGKVDYTQPAGKETKQDHLSDLRFLTGRRIGSADSHFTPYLGIGWRHAVSNSGGVVWPVDNVSVFDRRTWDAYYVPIGVQTRHPMGPGSYVELNAEFDYLLRGTTAIEFPQVSWTYKTTHNHGRGYRAGALFGSGSWAIGPFFTQWTIAKSSDGIEPETKTKEAGIRVRYTFN